MRPGFRSPKNNSRAIVLALAAMVLVFMAGCSASGESSSSQQPPGGGATVAAGGDAPSNGLFGSVAALGLAAALIGLLAANRKEAT